MGDRCYMRLTCRPCDKAEFEKLGFEVHSETATECEMVDESANWGHSGDMPTGIPYFGERGHGDQYDSAEFACYDGQYFQAYTDNDGDLIVTWDERKNRPWVPDVANMRHYLKVREQARKLFHKDPLIAQMAQAKFLAEHPGLSESKQTPGKPKQERTVKT